MVNIVTQITINPIALVLLYRNVLSDHQILVLNFEEGPVKPTGVIIKRICHMYWVSIYVCGAVGK